MSEVTQMRTQIAVANEAAQRGLTGLAEGTTWHLFITARMERLSRHLQQLETEGRQEEIQTLLLDETLWEEGQERL